MQAIFDIQDLGAEIAAIRKELRMTQAEVAEQAGVSRALISNLESGHLHDPGVKKLFRILKVLGKGIRIVPLGPPTLDDLLAEQETMDA
jgi:transcriptional regulator with XRE-family HTH domain